MGIRWDDPNKRFIDTQTNLVLSPSRVMSQLGLTIEDGHRKLERLAEAVFNNEITLESFADQMAETLRAMHLAEALKVKQGLDSLTPNNIRAVSRILRDEFTSGVGVDERGEKHPFGIIHLVDDIRSEQVTLSRLKYRLGLYGENARKSAVATQFSDQEDEEGITECLNILNKVKTEHHPICIEASARGWMSLEAMKEYGMPARHSKCRCTLIYR